jgi:hypothetical protein
MKLMVISLCTQTHATNRGHVCDDHIHKECHTVLASDELKKLVETITPLALDGSGRCCGG